MLSPLKKLAFRKFRSSEVSRHELNYLFWECTTRCNLNCIHCGSDCFSQSVFPDMPLNDFLAALDTIKDPPLNFIVVLTGGEPLLRNDIEICGREIRKRGMKWSLVSNGHLYNSERHNSLMNAGLGSLTISLDGLNESHNWLRRYEGSFDKVSSAISIAASSIRLNFDVVTCVNKRNIGELPAIGEFLKGKGVKAWRLFTITPIGRAKDNPDLQLTDLQFTEMMDFIRNTRKNGTIDLKFSCEGYVGKYETEVRDAPFFCRAGINIGSILIDGSISACPNNDRSFIQGNIYTDNLEEIWNNRFKPYRDRSWTRTGICSGCDQYRDCAGNGLHNWHGGKTDPLVCHYNMIKRSADQNKPV